MHGNFFFFLRFSFSLQCTQVPGGEGGVPSGMARGEEPALLLVKYAESSLQPVPLTSFAPSSLPGGFTRSWMIG